MADSFRMDMSGDKSYREDVLKTAMEVFEDNTRSLAVVKACEHARQDIRAKERAVSYLAQYVDPATTAQVIQQLSTHQHPISANIRISPDEYEPEISVKTFADD